MHLLMRTLATVFVSSQICVASAAVYRVEFQSEVRPLNPSSLPALPFTFSSDYDALQVSFLVDETTELLFGDFGCASGSTHCGARGFAATNLDVQLNGVSQSGWRFGTTSKSFFNGPIDLRGSSLFTPGGLMDLQNAWLPMIHDSFPEAALNVGQMYVSLGGFNFTSLGFAAVDANDRRALGSVSSTTSLVASRVPEPSSPLLVALALVALTLSGTRKQRTEA